MYYNLSRNYRMVKYTKLQDLHNIKITTLIHYT